MKARRIHIVPLTPQVVKLLNDLQPITGRGRYIFQSLRSRKGSQPVSVNAVLYALRRMASTRINEMGWLPDVIER